jgi:hypothetical protein
MDFNNVGKVNDPPVKEAPVLVGIAIKSSTKIRKWTDIVDQSNKLDLFEVSDMSEIYWQS